MAYLINSKIIENNTELFRREYKSFNSFLTEQNSRNCNSKDVFVTFSFMKMENLLRIKEYGILFNYFAQNWEGGFTEKESYALQQMVKIANLPTLFTSNACL